MKLQLSSSRYDILESKSREFDLLKHQVRCSKNPCHRNMIPLKMLRLSVLPRQFQDMDLLHWIIAVGCLTVRIEVEKYKLSSISSRLSMLPKKIISCFGSGKICLVKKFTSEMTVGSQFAKCPCSKCKISEVPSSTWGEIYVLTTASVVSKNMDVKSTKCRLFYDSEGDRSCIDLEVVHVETQEKFNRSWLTCATCDLELVEKVSHMLYLLKKLHNSVYEQYKTLKTHLAIIVSHPHGGLKHVSISIAVKLVDDFYSQLFYTTATCPGSGGAPVYQLNSWTDHIKYQHLHEKKFNNGISCSTKAVEMLSFEIQNPLNVLTNEHTEILKLYQFSMMMSFIKMGLSQEERSKKVKAPELLKLTLSEKLQDTSTDISQNTSSEKLPSTSPGYSAPSSKCLDSGKSCSDITVDEADLQSCKNCKKNPDHKGFTPIKTFTLQHLPKNFQDNDIYNALVSIANTIVQLTVTLAIRERPDIWPDSSAPYPGCVSKGKKIYKYGSGRVVRISIFSEDNKIWSKYKVCTCAKCKSSSTPNRQWGEVIVSTAAHVVFDSEEAKHTTCRLFYDSPNSPGVTIGPDGEVLRSDAKTDFCELKFVTCDMEMIQILEKVVHDNEVLWKKVHRKYQNIKVDPTPVFIISHPHGCSKHISLGKVINKIKRNSLEALRVTNFEYSTNTCPGSSGAPVLVLGFKEWMLVPHIHSGCKVEGQNISNKTIEFSLAEFTEKSSQSYLKFKNSTRSASQPFYRCGKEISEMMPKFLSAIYDDFEIPSFSFDENFFGKVNSFLLPLIPMEVPELD